MTTDEVHEKLLPNLSKSALRSTMSRRGIKAQLAKGGAKQALEKVLGKRRGGFHLLSLADVTALLRTKTKQPSSSVQKSVPDCNSLMSATGSRSNDMTLYDFCQELLPQRELACPSALLSVSTTGAAPMASPHLKTGSMKTNESSENNESNENNEINENNENNEINEINESIEISALQSASKQHPCAPQASQQTVTPAATDDSIQPTATAPTVSEENGSAPSTSASKTAHSTRRREPARLIRLSEETETELCEFKSFYTKTINARRPTTAMSETTACRHVQHMREFLRFCEEHSKQGAKPCAVLEEDLVLQYPEQRGEGLSAGTTANHVQSIIALVKYLVTTRGNHINCKWDDVPLIRRLRNMQNQLQVSLADK